MTSHSAGTASSEWRAHWPVLLPGLMGVSLCALHNYSFGVMIAPIEKSFGWTRAEIYTGPLIISCIATIVAPLLGIAVDRRGPRFVALAGVPLYCMALAALSMTSDHLVSWILHWALLGVATMFVLPYVWTAAVNSLFDKRRGMALAIVLCGTGLSAALVPSLANAFLDAYGWRGAYVRLAVIALCVTFPLVLVLFRGATDPPKRMLVADQAMTSGVSTKDGLRSRPFILICAAAVVFTFPSCALVSNGVPVLIAQGLDHSIAAGVAGLIGIGSIVGRLAGGLLLDRFDAKKVAAASVLLPTVAIAMLLTAAGHVPSVGAACFMLGLSVGTEYDACSYLAARHFGMRSFGTLFGTVSGLLLLGNGLAPLLANYSYDVTGSYTLMLWIAVPLCAVSAALFLMLPDYSVNWAADPQAPSGKTGAAMG